MGGRSGLACALMIGVNLQTLVPDTGPWVAFWFFFCAGVGTGPPVADAANHAGGDPFI